MNNETKELLVMMWVPTIAFILCALFLPDPLIVFPPVDFGLEPKIIPNYFKAFFNEMFPIWVLFIPLLFFVSLCLIKE